MTNVETTEDGNIVTASYGPEPTACSKCGVAGELYRHGSFPQEIHDLPTLGRPTVIKMPRKRYRCRACGGTFSQPIEGLNSKGTMTTRLVAYIQEGAVQRPFVHVAREVGITEGTVRNLFGEYTETLDERVRYTTPTILGIDELYLLGQNRCILTNVAERTLLDILPSRNQTVIFNRLMRLRGRENVKVVTMDMYRPYRECAKEALPQAVAVVDKFHIVRMGNAAMENVRMAVRAGLSAKARRGLMHDRFVLLKRDADLDEKQRLKLETWIGQYPELATAHAVKETFYGIWNAKTEEEARKLWDAWKTALPAEHSAAWKDVLSAMKNWETEIFAYFQNPYTNAYTEAMNGLVKIANRLGRGYSFEAIRAKMLYSRGERHRPGEGSALHSREYLESRKTMDVIGLFDGTTGVPISTLVEQFTHEPDSTSVYG